MIITKTPFRVSFAGGGSDLADFYEQHSGCVLSTTINKYCYLSIHPYFDSRYTSLKYSQNELVDDLSKIQHRIFNCVLNFSVNTFSTFPKSSFTFCCNFTIMSLFADWSCTWFSFKTIKSLFS